MSSTLTSANSFNLNDTPYAGTAYNATLTGASKTAQAQTSGTISGGTGDTLVASSTASASTLFGGSHYDSLLALGANVRLVQNSNGHDTLIGNSTTTFQLGAASLLGNNSLKGTGANGLLLGSSGTLNDAFSSMSGISSLSLTGNSAVTLGANASTEKLSKVYAGSGNAKIVKSDGYTLPSATFYGGSGNDDFEISSYLTNTALNVIGGAGVDTLSLVEGYQTLTDNVLRSISAVEVLSLQGGTGATLGTYASAAGFSTITGGGVGSYTINGSADTNTLTINTSANSLGHDLITGTAKNDQIIVNGNYFSTESINGGAGVNTLTISSSYVNINDAFANDKNLQVLTTSGYGSPITLGANAMATGLKTIIDTGSGYYSGGNKFTQLATDTLATTFVDINTGSWQYSDTFSIANQTLFTADSIQGNGTDVIQLLSPVTLNDSFSRDHGVNVLSLNGSSQVTLGAYASAAGLNSIIGGTGPSTIIASLDTPPSGTLTLDMRASTVVSAPGDSLVGSFTSPNDFIVNGNQFELDTIRGGVRSDTIQVNGPLSTEDGFQNIRGVEVLSLGGSSSVTLGANAAVAGIKEVVGSNSNDTLVQTSADTSRLTLLGGNGNDSISIFSVSELLGDSVIGGSGTDTLEIDSPAYLNDTSFSKVSGIEALQLTSQSSVTLGGNAQTEGLVSVFGGDGSDTFTQTSADTLHTALIGGGDSDLFKIANSTLVGNDTFIGGAGTDTLALTTASQTLSSFANISGVEVLSLSGGSNVVNLTGAEGGALASVIGGSGNDSFIESALGQFAINGAGGINTIALNAGGSTYDTQFGASSSIQVLQTADNSSNLISLASAAQHSGLSTIVSGANSENVIVDNSAFGNKLVIDGSEAAFNFAFFDNVNQFGGSTLIGSTLSDTNYGGFAADVPSGGNIGDNAFKNKTKLEALFLGGTSSYKYGTNSSAPTGVTLGAHAQAAGTTLVGTGSGKYAGPTSINQLSTDTLALSLYGGDSNDLFTIANSSLLANDSIYGGNGTDTLAISSADQTLSAFNHVSSIDVLSLSGGSNVVDLTSATFTTVIGGSGNDSFAVTASGSYASFGSASIFGGAGIDTVSASSTGSNSFLSVQDSAFGGLKQIEVVQLNSIATGGEGGGYSQIYATLGAQAQSAGVETLIATASGYTNYTTITQTASFNEGVYLGLQGNGDKLVYLNNGSQFAADTIVSGGYTDIRIAQPANLIDSAFNNKSGLTSLDLNYNTSGSSSVLLGAAASLAGVVNVNADQGQISVTIDGSYGNAQSVDIFGQPGNDYVLASSLSQVGFYGGASGSDTLAISSPGQTLNAFPNIYSVDVLSLSGGNNAATLTGSSFSTVIGGSGNDSFAVSGSGAYATNFGSANIYGGAGTDTVSITNSGYYSGITLADSAFEVLKKTEVVNLNSSASGSYGEANVSVTLGAAALASGLQSLNGSASGYYSTLSVFETAEFNRGIALTLSSSSNYLTLDNGAQFASDTLKTSNSGIYINQPTTLSDSNFANKTGSAYIGFNQAVAGASSVELGATASLAGVNAVGSGLGNLHATIDGSYGQNGVSFYGYNGNNYLQVASLSQVAGYYTGNGRDTLAFSNESQTLSNFNSVHSVEVLSLTGGDNVVNLTGAEGGSQFSTVIGGSGNDSFAVGNIGTVDIVGGKGIDTIGLSNSGATYVSDSLFSSVSSIEVLKTSASASYTGISLGSAAQNAGISTIIAAQTSYSGNYTGVYVDVQTDFNRPLYFDGLGSSDQQGLRFANATQVDNAKIYGGSNTLNYLQVQSSATLNDYQFSNIHNIQEIDLNAANVSGLSNITLSGNAYNAGISSIWGYNGSINLTQNTADSAALYINASGDLGGNVYNIADFSLLGGQSLPPAVVSPAIPNPFVSGDTIYGAGNDTLIVGGFSTISNQFTNVHGVEALSLTGSNSVVLIENSAYAAGIESVYGAMNGSTIAQAVTDTLGTLNSGVNIYGNNGNDLIALVGYDSVAGSPGSAVGLLNNDVIDGGRGTDTLALTSSSKYASLGDQSFVNVENVEVLSLDHNSINPTNVANPAYFGFGGWTATLGASAFHAGLETVTAGVGDTIYTAWNEVGRNMTLDASGSGIFSSENTAGFNLLIGQQERGSFGINNFIANSLLGNTALFSDTFTAAFQPLPYTTEFIVNNGAALNTSTVVGGLGFNDSLYIDSPTSVGGLVYDSNFQNTNLINNLVLNDNSVATLGSLASADVNTFGTGSGKYGSLSGVHTVWGGQDYDSVAGNTLGDTIVQSADFSTLHGLTVVGGHGNDSIVVSSFSQLQNDSIYGNYSISGDPGPINHGMDTLMIDGGVTLNDTFGNGQVNEIENLNLSCSTGGEGIGSAVTLGANFASIGLASINGSDCNDTIYIQSNDTLPTYVNGQDGNDLVTVNFGGSIDSVPAASNILTGSSLYAAGGEGTFSNYAGLSWSNAYQSYTSTSTKAPVTLNYFDNYNSADGLTLSGSAPFTLESGYFGQDNGSDTVTVAGYDSNGNEIWDVTMTGAENIPGTNYFIPETFSTLPASRVEIHSSSPEHFYFSTLQLDTPALPSLPAFNNDTLNGGIGIDTLVVGISATLADNSFTNVSNFEALQLTGGEGTGSSVTLGSTAQTAGFVSVYGSTGPDSISQLGSDTTVKYIYGNGGNDTISVANPTILTADTIDGGQGSNTLNAGANWSYSDSAFANKSNFDVLTTNAIGSASGSYTDVTLGGNALSAGFSSVISGSAYGNYVYHDTGDTKSLYIDNSASGYYSGLSFANDTLFAGDTLVGASANISNPYENWTDVYNGPVLDDSAFQYKTSLSGLYVYGDSAVTLGSNAQSAGISGLYADSGNDTLTVTTDDITVSTIRGGAGNDLVTVPSLNQFGGLYGGLFSTYSGSYSASGTDTLSLSQTLSNNDSFGNVHDFQVLQLSSSGSYGNAVTFGASADKAGFQSLFSGGYGFDTITVTTADTLISYINAEGGNDYVSVPTLTQFSTLDGGNGYDTLAISGGVTLNDGNFGSTNVINFEALQVGCSDEALSLGSAITLGANAASSGLASLIGSDCNDTFAILAADTLRTNINAADGNDLVVVDFGGATGGEGSLPAFNNNTLNGGNGTDTLTVGVTATLGDSDFTNISSFEALSLTGGYDDTNYVTLGSTAQTTGFSSVFAGTTANANVDASAYTNNIYITGSGSSYGMTFTGGSGNDTLVASDWNNSLTGGSGTDLFQFDSSYWLGQSTITGGDGTDSLQLTSAGTLNDASFLNVSTIEVLELAGGSNATLSTNAGNAGISSVYLKDSTGSGIYQLAGDTLHSYLSGSTGSDLFQFKNSTLFANDTIAGNGGTDTIAIMSAATLGDALFANVSGVSVLSLTGASTALLSQTAQASGLSSIFGGSGGDSISANFTGANTIYIKGGTGADTISAGGANDTIQGWSGTSTLNGSSDTLTGGNGADLFILGDATGNAYGQNGKAPSAYITDYNQQVDYLQLNGSSTNYSTQTLPGGGAYNLQVTDTASGGVVADLYVYNLDQSNFLTNGHVQYV